MKKLLALFLAILCVAPAALSEMENSIPAVGDNVCGFTVTNEEPFDLLGGTLVTMTHEKSGGTVVWLANDDTERTFTIGFRTHYGTDTGVPHVFEHAALSGSEKYPDSGLFFSMMNQLYQTGMNATTYTDMTKFYVSSLSNAQLLKIADVILSGVFEPLVIEDRHAMMREAYRYELPSADAPLSLTGTVYSEMQGSYYANAEFYALIPQLFPGSWHATCTGGKPGVIEEMTQQDLIDFHSTYYVPSNGITLLYGDLPLSDFLTLVGSYYDNFTTAEVSDADSDYMPFAGYSRVDLDIPASSGEDPNTTLFYAMPVRGFSETDLYLLNQFLPLAIDNESSAFYRVMMERFPNCGTEISFMDRSDSAEQMFLFELDNATDIVPEDFVAAVQEGLAANLAEGIHYEVLASAQKSLKKSLLTIRENSGLGVTYSQNLLGAFVHLGSASAYLSDVNALLNSSDEWLAGGILESVISGCLLNPADSRLVVATKKPGSLEEINAAAAQKLVDMKAAMTEEEITEAVDATADYNTWVDESASVSQIGEVRALTVADLPEEVKEFTASEETVDGVRFVTGDTGDSRLVKFSLIFDASGIPAEELARCSAMISMLGSVSTARHTYNEVILLAQEYGISFGLKTIGPRNTPDIWRPVFTVGVSCLREDLTAAVDAVWEILTETDFDEADLIRYLAATESNENRKGFSNDAPIQLAFVYALATLHTANRYSFETGATPYLRYLDSVGKMDDTALASETDVWRRLLTTLLNKKNLAVTAVSGQESISEVLPLLTTRTASLPETEIVPADYSVLSPISKSIAITVPGSANYNVKAIRQDVSGVPYSGSLQAVSGLITDQVLFPVMRYRNGVYTPGCLIARDYVLVFAYRDPSISVTYDEVLPTLGDSIRGMDLTQEDLDSYIINAYSSFAAPVGPIQGASIAVSDVINGNATFSDKRASMESLRSLRVEDLAENAVIFDALSASGTTVTAGCAASIEAESSRFETVETWYANPDAE